MINSIKFWYWRKYKNIAHPDEILNIVSKLRFSEIDYKWELRRYAILKEYALGRDVKEIANKSGVTRERVRQIVNLCYRNSLANK